MLLPHIADFAIAETRELGFGQSNNILMFVVYRTFGRCVEAADQVQEGAFSCAALAYDGDLLAFSDLQRQVAENDQIFVARAIDLREIFDADERRRTQTTV